MISAVLALAAPAAGAPAEDPSRSLALVDWLGWAASDRAVERYLREEARAPDGPYAPSLRPADRERLFGLDMPALYAVEATVDDVEIAGNEHLLVEVREAIAYRNPASVALHGLALRLFANGQDHRANGAHIQGVWVGGRPARFETDGTILSIELDAPLPPGRTARILLHLLEEVPAFDPRAAGDRRIDPEITGAFGRADGWVNLGYWLPVVTPVDKHGRFDIRPLRENTEHAMFDPALFHVVLNTPDAYTVATTGVEVDQAEDGDRAITVAVAAASRDFAVALVPSGRVRSTEIAGTRIRVIAGGTEAMGAHLMEYAERAVRVYTERFGPLAIAELDVVEAPIRTLTGLDWPGLVAIDASHRRVPYHRNAAHEWAVAHEIAHQWWAGEVGSDPALAPWLDEALAAHSASLYWLDRYGEDALDARMSLEVVDRLRRLRRQGRPDLPANLPAWKYDLDQYAAIVYGRGSLFFDRVRRVMGDERFFGALGRYHTRFTGRFATPADLLEVLTADLDRESAARIEALYTRWIVEAHSYEDLLPALAEARAGGGPASGAHPRP